MRKQAGQLEPRSRWRHWIKNAFGTLIVWFVALGIGFGVAVDFQDALMPGEEPAVPAREVETVDFGERDVVQTTTDRARVDRSAREERALRENRELWAAGQEACASSGGIWLGASDPPRLSVVLRVASVNANCFCFSGIASADNEVRRCAEMEYVLPAPAPGLPSGQSRSSESVQPAFRIGARCADGWRSEATGRGACSWHGGVSCWRYSDGTCRRS